MNRAAFLDRDGVLIEDVHLLTRPGQLRLFPDAAGALNRLHQAGFRLVVVTNQPVIARGLATEAEVQAIHDRLVGLIRDAGGPALDGIYVCPHHPNATLPAYRLRCECRKPEPGLLLRAASDHHIALRDSFMIGDRPTDIAAGARAGCRTILVQSGRHLDPPIESGSTIDLPVTPPDHACPDLTRAVDWILTAPLMP